MRVAVFGLSYDGPVIAVLGALSVDARRIARSRVVQNAGALALVQSVGYLVPLVTLPYLTRVLGPEEWGRVAWMQVILGYFTVLTDWGFSWSGVRKAAELREHPAALSRTFFASWAVQWGLCLLSLTILTGLSLFAPFFAPFRPYAIYGAGIIVGSVLFPVWLLTGLERMREVAAMQLVIRGGSVPLILLLVREPGHGPRVIGATAMAGVIGGLVALFWLRKNLALTWRWPCVFELKQEFLESGEIFLSRVWIIFYTSLIPTILGALTNAVAVGNYVLADKIRLAVQSLLAPITQALFPRMSYLFAHDKGGALRLLRRSGALTVLSAATASLALFLLAGPAIRLTAGNAYAEAIPLLRWLSPLPLVIVLSQVASVQTLLSCKKYREFNKVLLAGGLFGLATCWGFILLFDVLGAAWFQLVVEAGICIGMWSYAYPLLNHHVRSR